MIELWDFYAEWCVDSRTPILAGGSGGLKLISEVEVDHPLVSVNPETLKAEIQRVEEIKVTPKVPIFKVTLETGRTLKGHQHHQVLTSGGWKFLKSLSPHDSVLVKPTKDYIYEKPCEERAVLESTGDDYSDNKLRGLGLLPIWESDPRLVTLARLLGFLITDGYLYEARDRNICETHFSLGTVKDAENLAGDLKLLGFEVEIKHRTRRRKIGERPFTISEIRCRSSQHALFYLFKALGAPAGRKKTQKYSIPDWILDAPKHIKREFLSGWLGGDGTKISTHIVGRKGRSNYSKIGMNPIEFHKDRKLEKSGLRYAEQLSELLAEFGVDTLQIKSEDDKDGVIISIILGSSYRSLAAISNIGYAYSSTKDNGAKQIGEFLRYRLKQRDRHREKRDLAISLINSGENSESVARTLNVPLGTVFSWKYNSRSAGISREGESLHTGWVESRKVNEELLYEKVVEVGEVAKETTVGISVSGTSTLVTNGIVSHNCPPCKITTPIVEELQKEFAGQVSFKKIDVDKNPNEAAKYGVMSIPTFIIFKDGQEVSRKMGAISKIEFASWLKENLS